MYLRDAELPSAVPTTCNRVSIKRNLYVSPHIVYLVRNAQVYKIGSHYLTMLHKVLQNYPFKTQLLYVMKTWRIEHGIWKISGQADHYFFDWCFSRIFHLHDGRQHYGKRKQGRAQGETHTHLQVTDWPSHTRQHKLDLNLRWPNCWEGTVLTSPWNLTGH